MLSGQTPSPASSAQSASQSVACPPQPSPASATGPTAGPSPVAAPAELSAQALHELALEAFRVGNRGRLSLCEALRVLAETRLHLDLGYPSIAGYADAFFQLRRAEAFEYVRVARRLVELTELREAFGQGGLGWSSLKAITRVASVSSQASWIAFAQRNGVEHTLAEARDALRQRRDAPRESSYGLPNLDQKLVLRFSRSEMEKVRSWIENACASVVEQTGAEEVTTEQALLFLCEQARIAGAAPGQPSSESSRAQDPCRTQIVYQQCPDCRRSRVGTRDGFVEVAPEEVERHAGCAEPVAIEGPTPPKLRRSILAREAGRCANPRCHNRADHCHHIVFRSRGGKTELYNEAAVCATCHALIHAGLLRLSRQENGELLWSPVASGASLQRDVTGASAVAEQLPVLQLVAETAASDGADRGAESANADPVVERVPGEPDPSAERSKDRPDLSNPVNLVNQDDLARGLMRLGLGAARSRRMITAAVEALPRAEITEANVLRRAIASI